MEIMKKKRFYILLSFLFLLILSIGCTKTTWAREIPIPRVILNVEKDTVTTDNAVIHATLYNDADENIEKVTLTVYDKDAKKQLASTVKEINQKSEELSITFDFQKDLGLTLQPDTVYVYLIQVKTFIFKAVRVKGEILTAEATEDQSKTAAKVYFFDRDTEEIVQTDIIDDLKVGLDYTHKDASKIVYAGNGDNMSAQKGTGPSSSGSGGGAAAPERRAPCP